MKRGTMYHSKIKKAQTATEYLIILAVVIIISLVVVSVLGGIPSIGGSSSEQTARLQLAAAKVGITDYYISEAKGLFTFKNNQATTIRIDSVTVDGKKCFLIGSNSNPTLEPILRAGESQTVSCGSITAESDESYTYAATINYTDTKTQA